MTISTPPVGAGSETATDLDLPTSKKLDESTSNLAGRVHEEIDERPWLRRLAQLGWVAKAVVYASIGWAALEIGRGSPTPDDAEYTGIVSTLAAGGFTRFLLAVIAIGLVLYIVFRVASIALIDDNDLDAWAHRVGYFGSVATYVGVSWTAGRAAISGPRPKGEGTVERLSRGLLETAPGRVALVIGGLVAFGVAAYFLYKGATRRFVKQIDLRDAGSRERQLIEYSGAVGWIARGLIVAFVAVFVTWSAIDADPNDARGLDSSLNRIANEEAWGQGAVVAVGVGLVLYALFCLVSARRRRLAWENNPEPGHDKRRAGKKSKAKRRAGKKSKAKRRAGKKSKAKRSAAKKSEKEPT